MKYIQLILLSLLIAHVCNAQNSNSFKKEIGIGYAYIPITINIHNFYPEFYYNASFKIGKGHNFLRSGYTGTFDFRNTIINLGYERRFLDKSLNPIIGADLCYFSQLERESKNYALIHFGIGPVIGVNWNLKPRFLLQSEIGLFYGPLKENFNSNGNEEYRKGGAFTFQRFLSLNLIYKF